MPSPTSQITVTSRPTRTKRRVVAAVALACACVGAGCSSSVRVTDPSRSATEQFLLSGAATRAVNQISVDALRGRKVFMDTAYFASSEQPFVIGELRAKMMLGGVQLMLAREEAEIVVEVRSGGVGVDRSDFLFGVPSVVIRAGSETTDVPLATPELVVVKNIKQLGVASVAYVAYWKDSGEVVATSGPFVGRTRRQDWWFLGFGRKTLGDIPPTEVTE